MVICIIVITVNFETTTKITGNIIELRHGANGSLTAIDGCRTPLYKLRNKRAILLDTFNNSLSNLYRNVKKQVL